MVPTIPARERWLAAICYVPILVILPILSRDKSAFLVRHCRQGFALLFAEIVGWLLLHLVGSTVGMIPFLGFLVVVVLNFVVVLLFLGLSIMGFVRALFGEEWRIPYLDELAEKVPIE
jgi:uncharacterized membrane protein